MFKYVYPRIWPIIFLALGLASAMGTHIHFDVGNLSITSHNMMWFCMALAHVDVFWRGRNGVQWPGHH